MSLPASGSPPLVIIDTNVLFDFFLGRDPEILLLASLAGSRLDIRVPEFVILEFRGSVLREINKKEERLNAVQEFASDLNRGDEWKTGVQALRDGCWKVEEDIVRLRGQVDPFVQRIRTSFVVVPHSPDIHYRGDLRFVQGLPPDQPKRGVQDCRIFEAALDIARTDASTARPERFFLTKDADFLKKPGVKEELLGVGVQLVKAAGPIYGKYKA